MEECRAGGDDVRNGNDVGERLGRSLKRRGSGRAIRDGIKGLQAKRIARENESRRCEKSKEARNGNFNSTAGENQARQPTRPILICISTHKHSPPCARVVLSSPC